HAASVHVGDWMMVTGVPYIARPAYGLRKPKNRVPGTDVAGTVEAVGQGVTELRPGDEVFGWCTGAFAEYVCAAADHFVAKPPSLTFEQAAAVGVSASTALQLLRDQAKVQPGQKVLVNGASGGLGTFAVQVAKAFGAEVTGVCSTRNVNMVRSIGADHVIDYTREDFTQGKERYDFILDNVGNHSLSATRRVLTPTGKLQVNNGTSGGRWFGTIGTVMKTAAASGLATLGARVGITGRDLARAEEAAADIRATSGNTAVDAFAADLTSQAEVRRLATAVLAAYPRLDVLVNNVGGFWAHRHPTADGLERTFALNHLAPFLLTTLLLYR